MNLKGESHIMFAIFFFKKKEKYVSGLFSLFTLFLITKLDTPDDLSNFDF